MRIDSLLRAAVSLLAPRRTSAAPRDRRRSRPAAPSPSAGPKPSAPSLAPSGATIREYDVEGWGTPSLSYSPDPDNEADPGEVVWGWVPYEDDPRQGKDRPVLVVGTRGRDLVGVQLTSKDHSRDGGREAARGRTWVDVGSGAWDSRGRESEVRVDRVLLVPRGAVRREGATLARVRFDVVVAALRGHHGW
ncbi:type II toxin-antitoxin system PemK/MazF family toxin [Litorihabitans aurantiacus]|uniref:Type II toxin-antitoxin system PemK/MazF family toxin n=1 Tax=Litorihabitans aurantiacus TaxID=1930061 RepID=A0AA37UPW9_9MICO|nr:type II toxin-antitoxin system PemK/MazF family toxin [Litorihabitans aurantiacus]GMA30941.1 hypothetical protein GCM10025875_09330 [Litorihabitans aurantiacus]